MKKILLKRLLCSVLIGVLLVNSLSLYGPQLGIGMEVSAEEATGTNKECKISVAKVDQDGNYIEGAVLQIFKDGEKTPYIDDIKPGNTGSTALEKTFTPGTYYIVEKSAPSNCSKDLEGVKQYFTVGDDLVPSLGRPVFEEAEVVDLDANNQRFTIADQNGNYLNSYSDFDRTVGYENVTKIIVSMSAVPTNIEYKVNSSSPVGGAVDSGAYYDYLCSAIYDSDTKRMIVTFSEPVNINNILFAKFDGEMTVSDAKVEIKSEPDPNDYKAIKLDKTSGENVLSFENEVIVVKNDVTFKKINDSTEMGEPTTGENYATEIAEERVVGAWLVLKLVEPETKDATLEGVTSNLDDRDYNKGCPDIKEDEIRWKTIEDDLKLSGLPNGKYELVEEDAPEGHQPLSCTTIVIKDGEITSDNPKYVITANKSESKDASVTAIDELFAVSVRKSTKISDSVEVPVVGAKLRLTGVRDGKSIDMSNVHAKNELYFMENGSGIKPDNNNSILAPYKLNINNIKNISDDRKGSFEYYSTGGTVVFVGLPCGEYTLEEIETPFGMLSASSRTFSISYDENGKLFLESGGDEGNTENVITQYNAINNVKISKTDMDGNIIEGAEFELARLDGEALDNVSVVADKDKAKSRIIAFVAESYDQEDNNDKAVEIALDGKQAFTISGRTMNNIVVNDKDVNNFVEQNVYTYSGEATDKLVISGMFDGIYVVTLDDGFEYTIRCDKAKAEISQIDVNVRPKISEDKADLKDNTAILSTDKSKLIFTGGIAYLSSLAEGRYILKETASPNGYTKVESEFDFVVENGKVSLSGPDTTGAIVKNDNEIVIMDDVSELDFYMFYDEEDNVTPDDTTEGALMKLTFNNASDKTVNIIEGADTLEVGESVTWNTNDENPKELEGLMDGEYILEEQKAQAIYEKAEPRKVIIKDGAVALMNGDRIIGTRPYTHILSIKKDSIIIIDKKALGAKEIPEEAGRATFTLVANDEGADLKGIVVNDIEITESTDRISFDGNTVTVYGLVDGKYTLIEDKAPIGYDVVSAFTFNVENEAVTRVDTVTNGRTYIEDDGKKLVIEDAPIITIDKKALGAEDIPEEAGKAEFTLNAKTEGLALTGVVIGEGEDAIRVKDGETSIKFEGNRASITGLKDGKYSLVENKAPLGYLVVAEFEFEIEDGLVKNVQAVTNGKTSVSADGKTLTVEDAPFLYINKKDLDGEEIPAEAGAATFVLEALDEDNTLEGVKINDGEALGEVTSVEFTGNGTKLGGLKDGKYSLEETVAPDGFTTVTKFTFDIENGLVKIIEVEEDGDAVVSDDGKVLEVFDTKSVIIINKKAFDGEKIPEEAGAATFVLEALDDGNTLGGVKINDGEALGEVTSVEFVGNGTKFEGLKDGKYSLEESVAPIGFTTVTKFTFDIENGLVENVEVETDGDAVVSEDGKILTVQDRPCAISADVTATNRVYDGTEKPLVNVTGKAINGKMNYTLGTDGKNVPSEGWDTDIPTRTETGTYYVWYKAVGDVNCKSTEPTCVKVIIRPVDKTDLNKAISDAETYYYSIKDEAIYSEVASALKTAIDGAKLIATNDNVDETTVNSNKTAIIQAKANAVTGKKEVDDKIAEKKAKDATDKPTTSDPVDTKDKSTTNEPVDVTDKSTSNDPETVTDKTTTTVKEEGTPISDAKSKIDVVVTSKSGEEPTVAITKVDNTAKTVKVSDTITDNGVTYKVTAISDKAFKNNKNVVNVRLGNNIRILGKNTFEGCPKLKSVTLSKNIVKIPGSTFRNCKSLKSINLNNVKEIGDGTFENCSSLTSLTLGGKICKIGRKAFKGTKIKTLTIKSSKLTKKAIKGALTGSNIKIVRINVGNKQQNKMTVKNYKKIFTKKITGRKVIVK
ncbi:MAG: leucine-rich repeat protein [Lachnospiraceae bacterium]|nr:leucine-rich repeat protein [Lachnospiraceae bacterium]